MQRNKKKIKNVARLPNLYIYEMATPLAVSLMKAVHDKDRQQDLRVYASYMRVGRYSIFYEN